MAATAASAAKSNKRKPSISDMSDSESDSDSPSSLDRINANGKVSASQQLVPVPGQPDAPLVTKRTLQNRKAQREFRKRREARVRELEERCRRFDQMGLEANSELQRLARRLKDENEALKSLIARLGFAHMIPGIIESLNGHEQQQHHPQHPQFTHNAPPQHPHNFGHADPGMDAWAHASGMPASLEQMNGSAATANKRAKRPVPSSSTAPSSASTSAPSISSLAQMPAFTELLPANAAGVNPSLLSDSRRNDKNSAAIAIPTNNKSAATARPIEDNNSTFDNDWFAQLAQSGHDKDDADVESASAAPSANKNSMNPILSLNFNNSDSKSQSKSGDGNSTGSAMLGSNSRPFGMNLANALGLPANSTSGNNMFPMPMPTQQNGALLNPNPIPFAFNLSDNKAPGDQSWWSQVAGNALDGDDSVLDEKAQAVAQATGAASPFDLSAFLNGGLTPGGGFSFGSQQNVDDEANNDAQKLSGPSSDESTKPSNGKGGEKPGLTSAEHAQMFLRLLEAKMAKQSTSPYSQLGFQPPSHHQQYAASQAGPSSSDASSSGSSSSGAKDDDDSSLSPINIYSRLAQHPAFLSTNASELEELVDSIGSSQRQQKQRFQSPRNQRRSHPTKAAPAIYLPNTGLTPSIYGPNGAAALQSQSPSSGGSPGGKDLEVDENAVTKMLGLLDRKTSRDAAAANGLAY